MIQIDPTNVLDKVDYASTVMYEMYTRKDHYHDKKGNYFGVKTIFNGKTLKFDACDNEEICTIEDFWKHMGTRLELDVPTLHNDCNAVATADQYKNSEVPDWHWSQSIFDNRPKVSEIQDMLHL